MIFDKAILPSIKDCGRDKRYQNENRQILYQITGPEQKRPNCCQNALHNDHFKKALVKFIIYNTWGEEKYVTILKTKNYA